MGLSSVWSMIVVCIIKITNLRKKVYRLHSVNLIFWFTTNDYIFHITNILVNYIHN